MHSPVRIVDYDPQWPIQYEVEKDRIFGVIGHIVVAIEHIGSTAVPGLGAKPIIDIMIAVHHLTDAEKCIESLKSISYEYVPEFEDSFPERRFFWKGPPKARKYHIHMVELTGDFWKRHLLFRDYLRSHPEVARKYHHLKKELAAKHGSDRDAYTDAKTSFIKSVEDKARSSESSHQ